MQSLKLFSEVPLGVTNPVFTIPSEMFTVHAFTYYFTIQHTPTPHLLLLILYIVLLCWGDRVKFNRLLDLCLYYFLGSSCLCSDYFFKIMFQLVKAVAGGPEQYLSSRLLFLEYVESINHSLFGMAVCQKKRPDCQTSPPCPPLQKS